MAALLWKIMAYLPRNMISVEALGGTGEISKIQQLVAWGVLKKNGSVYSLDKEKQNLLLRLFEVDPEEFQFLTND